MSSFGVGVGGGLLAAAGAAQGLGQGMSEVGQQQQKVDLETKMNDLATQREEAIERLKGAEQEKLQSSGQAAQEKMQGNQQEFEKGQTATKLGAASAAAGATRNFEQGENEKNRATQVERSQISAKARVDSATVSAASRESKGSGSGGKTWEVHTVTSSGIDPVSKMPTQNQKQVLVNNRTGASYMQIGDKYIRYNAQTNAPMYEPKALSRAPAADLQDLMNDPLGKVPVGKNAGMQKADAFEQAHGYLPAQWTAAAQGAESNQRSSSSTSSSLPAGLLKGAGGPNATSTQTGSFGGGGPNADEGAADNAAQGEEDEDNASQPFQSSAMNNYSANAN